MTDPSLPRILLVEDNAQMAFVMLETLRRSGFAADGVPDGQAAWECVERMPAKYSVIITDNQMPRITELELVRKLRANAYSGKIIVHSGNLSAETLDAFGALDVRQILRKTVPFAVVMQPIAASE